MICSSGDLTKFVNIKFKRRTILYMRMNIFLICKLTFSGSHFMIGLNCSHDPVVCPRDQVYRLPGKFKTFLSCVSMDMIDHTLETSEDKDGDSDTLSEHKELISSQTLTIVEEDGSTDLTIVGAADEQVTYRVVSVRPGENVEGLPQIVSANTNYTGNTAQPGVQALLTNPINGQFYVIGSPQEVFTTQSPRSLVSRSGIQIENASRSSGAIRPRDDRRRATHNEVERRRRDKINYWIMKLSKIIPECSSDSSKGNFEAQSKGGILAKACDYITELRTSNHRLAEYSKENEQLVSDMEVLGRQIEELRMENDQLRAQLAEHGISPCLDPLTIT